MQSVTAWYELFESISHGRIKLFIERESMAQASPYPVLLTVKEVSTLLRIHRPKVYDLIRDGTIEGFKLGSDWRIKRESIEKLIGPIPETFFGSRRQAAQEADDLKSKAA